MTVDHWQLDMVEAKVQFLKDGGTEAEWADFLRRIEQAIAEFWEGEDGRR